MPITLNLQLPQKEFYVFKNDLENIKSIADFIIPGDDFHWNYYDELYKNNNYLFELSWEFHDLITNESVELKQFYGEEDIEKFPFNFYYEKSNPEDRRVFLSSWENTINPYLLNDFLHKIVQSDLYNDLNQETQNQITKTIKLTEIAMKYAVRIGITIDPD
ncbi:hypothetical protein [Flavobacterium reichenbachii]|uniref:Uncharacterized protein n=1 Tax=Flavobacterium reichenbachii TaxID=362418 RepID=A0A085ZQG3_9FLAO|nr:hypothetical protein [Flavobacterium reichenbachii]KFF06677.1 hypothetical protein IW19_14700 [Flavobacterium reichenbachii]OXB18718.1 hypothetical protein B0A68_01505 [Flavobacterium reichenbachii]